MEIASSSPNSKHEGKAIKPPRPAYRRKRIICLSVLGVIIFLILLFVILGFTVFKPKRPVTTINSVALDDLDVSLDLPRLKVNLNLSLDVDLSIKNPNKVGFKYTNSSVILYYRGEVVGEAPLPANKISPDETMPMNVTLTLMADRLLSDGDLYSDILSGTLPVSTFTRISGKVIIFNVFKVHVVSETTCDVTINVSNRTVSDSECKYKTKL